MERYCGYLQAALKSKVSPWADLNNRILHKAYMDQIDIFYDLNGQVDQLSRVERIFPTCELFYFINSIRWQTERLTDPNSILKPPSIQGFPLDNSLLKRIAGYIHVVIGQETSEIKRRLPLVMCQWGKVRIANGGDRIRCRCASLPQKNEQNMSFVRVIIFIFLAPQRTDRKSFTSMRLKW